MFEIFKEFRFDSAHFLPETAHSHGRYGRMHGHSFRAQVFVRGKRQAQGWVVDFGELESLISAARDELDHRILNDVDGLGEPTLENLAEYIWNKLSSKVAGLYKVVVHRDSSTEGCAYFGSAALE